MNPTNKILGISVAVISIFAVMFFVIFGKKIKDAKKIKIAGIDIAVTKFSIFDGIDVIVNVQIGNYSNADFNLQQISLNAFTEKGKKIASQTEPLLNSIILKAGQNVTVPVKYNFDQSGVTALLKDSDLINSFTDAYKVLQQYVTTKKIGAKIKLIGFITAEDITVNINETIEI